MRTTITRGLGAACLLICGVAASAAADATDDPAPRAADDVAPENDADTSTASDVGSLDHTVNEVSPVALATSMTDDEVLAANEDAARLALGEVGPRVVPATLEGSTDTDLSGYSDDERRTHYLAAIGVEEVADDDTSSDTRNDEDEPANEDEERSGEAADSAEADDAVEDADDATEADDAEAEVADDEPAEPAFEGADGEAITAERIETFLDGRGSPLRDHAATFVEAGVEHEVDPRVVVGIAVAESSAGEALPSGTHNAWGWGGAGPQGLASWSSWDESIDAYTERLGALYDTDNVNEGFARTYCPPNWRWWLDTVTWVIDEI